MKIALGVEYDGNQYHGWQRQKNTAETVQQKVEEALAKLAIDDVRVVCSGRTDAGVHAFEQVVHFSTNKIRPPHQWVLGCNTNLPDDIRIVWMKEVDDDFHARFSAVARYYRYEILNRGVKSALYKDHVTTIFKPLDEGLMQSAAQTLIGTHDFSSFRAQGCQAKTAIRQIHWINVRRYHDKIIIDIIANAFLYHMVRNIVGTLLPIGLGEAKPESLTDVLRAKDRSVAGVTAKPNGLYFKGVYYPQRFELPYHRAFKPYANTIESGLKPEIAKLNKA